MDELMEMQQRLLVLLLMKKKMLLLRVQEKRKKALRRTTAVRPFFMGRQALGFFYTAFQEMMLHDEVRFKNFLRMTPQKFNELVRMVAPNIAHNNRSHHGMISVQERLCLTLRFLASGDSVTSISYLFRVGKSTTSNIIAECLRAIWEVLAPKVFKFEESNFHAIASGFEHKWDMPNCIGAIDGKHVNIQAPPNSGSNFYNYKKTFSIVLLAVADASSNFLYCDIGAFGKQSDGGVYRASSLGKLISRGIKDPLSRQYGDTVLSLPYYLVGDAAFSTSRHMMRPYSERTNFTAPKKILNFRLSHARQCIERAFGILVQKFRIFRKPIQLKLENVEWLVKAAVCLHNWLHAETDILVECPESSTSGLSDLNVDFSPTTDASGDDVVKQLTEFFLSEGAQPYQWGIL